MASRWSRRLPWLLGTLVVALAGAVGMAFLATYYFLRPTLPDVAELRDLKLQMPLRVYSRDGRLIGQIGEQRRLPVAYAELPEVVVEAFLAAEDDRFFEHPGIDWQGMTRALLVAAGFPGPRQGGSTITQQLVRTTLIENERTLRRKLREIFLAITLEHELSKQEILELFLNTVFLGQRSYGVAAAAETYFGKRLQEITIAEAALLAGLPQAPSRYNPVASRELAERRRSYVLRRMLELGFIDEEEQRVALETPVSGELHGPRVEVDAPWAAELARQAMLAEYGERAYTDGLRVVTTIDSRLQRAADVALRSAVLEYDRRHGYRGVAGKASLPAVEGPGDVEAALQRFPSVGGLLPAVVLAVDGSAARVATRSRGEFDIPFDNMRWARPSTGPGAVGPAPRRPADVLARGDVVYVLPEQAGRALLVQVPDAQGALVAVDPQDGAIVAMSGGFDFYATSFNRATQAKRQPGSAFKPFIYSAALDSGLTPASLILDAPVVYEAAETGSGQDWRPQNVDARFYGPTRLRDALARSRNLVSVRVMRSIGVGPTLDFVQNFGFPRSQLPDNLTTALGTAQVTPLEMASAYAVFANGGQRVEPYLIDRVEDTAGAVLSQSAPLLACPECGSAAGYGRALVSLVPGDGGGVTRAEEAGGAVPEVPQDRLAPRAISAANAFVMTDMMRDVIRAGTARRALALGRSDLAGKTGTTNDRRDAWFAGFNAGLVAVSWVGFDQERSLGNFEEGGRTALPMWVYFMREALRGRPEQRLPMPEGVINARVSPVTGALASPDDPDAFFEFFLAEHPPAGTGAPDATGTGRREEPLF
ncbi:MAG: penicillin-binding protein 1A [Steroidobacteraceae bacterium]|jgi:penicillin-binding protein 1A|nr:penicillin-binding protein 1A [Steroidobacteraceae bacterium]